MKVLTDQMVTALAVEMKKLGMSREVVMTVVHMMDTEKQAQEMLEYLKSEQPTDKQVLYQKMEEILG